MVNMLGRRQKLKYEIVDTVADDVDLDLEPVRRKVFTPACLWTSFTTSLLISIYFAPSIGLTFYQRWLLQKFKFPLSIVLVHMLVKYLLAAIIRNIIALRYGRQRILLGWKDYIISVAPTGIFSGIDIGFSNWGLELITISLYTMTKSTVIIFILIFAILLKLEKKSWSLSIIVVMISIGLLLFTYKATQFNAMGFTLVLIASLSSGLRWTCLQLMLQKSKMGMKNPIDMIYHMQPFMMMSLLPFAFFIEGPSLIKYCQSLMADQMKILTWEVLAGALLAFFMEVTEVMVVTYTSSLTLSIAGIFKEVFILILAVLWNGDKMSLLNVVGLILCLGGIGSHVIHKIRNVQIMGPSKSFDFNDRYDMSMGKSLIHEVDQLSVSSSNDDEHDSQVLFNILNRHDR